ncbi:MAG: nuclear transport factor 2 family protein [Acidimicrobiales bacterium]
MTDQPHDIADRFFAAIERGDLATVDSLYAEDVVVWNSVLMRPMDKARSLAVLDWIMAPDVNREYEVHERIIDGDRLAQRHTLRVTVPGHDVIEMPVSLFITITDGRITAIDEYVDSKATDRLVELIPRRA